jgi:hypothetical protein
MIIPSVDTQAPSLATVLPRLLAEFCQVNNASHASGLEPRQLALRATTVTILLKEILVPSGWHHGGIND